MHRWLFSRRRNEVVKRGPMDRIAKHKRLTLVAAACLMLPLAACGDEEVGGPGGDGLEEVRLGYLHTVAVDAHMWLGIEKGFFEDRGIDLKPTKFDTGIALSQALAGGSLDTLVTGAVISNFPSRGQGKVFLVQNVEFATAQLWVDPKQIKSVEDLRGKQVATTQGTTAHVFLHTALKDRGMDDSDVKIVNSDMSGAVNAFISGAVPAVVLWVPFDQQVQKQRPDAKMLDHAGNYYPDAAIVSGWAARNDFYEERKDILEKIVLGWLDTNDYLMKNTEQAVDELHQIAYSDVPKEVVTGSFEKEKVFNNDEWAELVRDGTTADWLGGVEQVFVEIGAFDDFVPPEEWYDPQIFLDAYEKWQAEQQ